MANNVVWYAGRCVKRTEHDKAAHLEAVAQLVDGKWRLIENPDVLFRHMNDVELRAVDARQIKVSDWAAFTIGSKGSRAKSWPATAHRRLHRYMDLSYLGSAEQVHRVLVGDGVQTKHPSGIWIVRCAENEVLQFELRQSGDVAHFAAGNGKVPAYHFDPEAVVRMPGPDGEIELYDLRGTSPVNYYDWAPDDAFALRVVQAAAHAGDPRARDLVSWLELHARKLEGLLSLNPSDFAAANEALRSGKLAKRLAADQALLRTFVNELAAEERVGALIKESAERIAEQERARARAQAEMEAKREMEAARKHRLAALESELERVAEELRTHADAELQRLRAEADEELRRTVGARAEAMEKLANEMDMRCKALGVDAAKLEAVVEERRQKIESLRVEAAEVQASIDALRGEAAVTADKLAAEQSRFEAIRLRCPLPGPKRAAKPLALERVGTELEASKLLSANGKVLMAHFLALVLAGEVPVLCGAEVDDFLLVAEIMFAGGRSVRMEGDPTIITFEDLWIRAGTDLRTALGQALATAAGAEGEPRTTLAVIERAERSGARFWYPTLADRAQRGDLPRRLLICMTIEDHECDEVAEILRHTVRLEVNDALAPSAAIPLAMAASTGTATELDPGVTRADVALGAPAVTTVAAALGSARCARAMRAAAEAKRMSPPARPSTLVHLFRGPGGNAVDVDKTRSTNDA